MLGFYPDCPAEDFYQLGIPAFDRAAIKLSDKYYSGKEFIIERKKDKNLKDVHFELNGNETKLRLNHEDIIKGGKLIFYTNE